MISFEAYIHPLAMMYAFQYLGSIMTAVYDNWKTVVTNLQKERKVYASQSRIMGKEGADARTSGCFHVTDVQATLLFGSETWVLTPGMVQTLGGFHHRVERRLMKKLPKRRLDGVWY